MNEPTLPALLAALPEMYQPVYGHPEHRADARRDCEDRLQQVLAVHDALVAHLGRPLRVLDLGCAQGFFSFSLAARGASVTGVDLDPASIALCEHLAEQQRVQAGQDNRAEPQIAFRHQRIEDALDTLQPGQVDLVLGLSVFHHLVHAHGLQAMHERLLALGDKVRACVLELALAGEPLNWAASLPAEPRELLRGWAFVHQLSQHPTHLSTIQRPLLVASRQLWVLPPEAGVIDQHLSEPHPWARDHYRGSRHYYRSGGRLIKLFRFEVDRAFDNAGELAREAALLREPPTGLPVPELFHHEGNPWEGWLLREWLPGELLSAALAAGRAPAPERVMVALLEQLAILEAAGLYHDDLRLWNLLLQDNGELRLIDYGSLQQQARDRAWPHSPPLALLILLHELLQGEPGHPDPLRPAQISPWDLPPFWRAWLEPFWEQPLGEWRYADLLAALQQQLSAADNGVSDLDRESLPTLEDGAATLLPAQAWQLALEQSSSLHSRHLDYLDWQVGQFQPRLAAAEFHVEVAARGAEEARAELKADWQAVTERLQVLEQAGAAAQQAAREAAEAASQSAAEAMANRQALDAVFNSASWRITAPLRGALAVLQYLRQRLPQFIERGMGRVTAHLSRLWGRLLRWLAGQVVRRPGLRGVALRVLTRLPALSRYLERRVLGTAPSVPRNAWQAPEVAHVRTALARVAASGPVSTAADKPTLAFVSPLPPARSGIADYSAELLPELSEHFAITLVNTGAPLSDLWLAEHLPVIDGETFLATAHHFDHVLYHLGNSEFHTHMAGWLDSVPGVVVLHDFFLGHLHAARQFMDDQPGALLDALYRAHGWPALKVLGEQGMDAALLQFPANAHLLANATGVIVHSEHARELAREWLGDAAARQWQLIPHLRRPVLPPPDRGAARRQLGLPEDAFVVCSFGFLGPTKCNQALLQAWQASSLAQREDCYLVFVGKNPDSDYGEAMLRGLRDFDGAHVPRITGFAEPEVYRQWLAAADVAVQLRRHTRGESSGTALDCLAHGAALVLNAHGSMADFPGDAVLMLPDAFGGEDLCAALERLHAEPELRGQLAERGRRYLAEHHEPAQIAEAYHQAIVSLDSHSPMATFWQVLREQGARLAGEPASQLGAELQACASALVCQRPGQPRWFVDITALRRAPHVTGIERVTREHLFSLLESAELSVRVIPVYADDSGGYREARNYLLAQADTGAQLDEPLVLPRAGDLFFGLDWAPGAVLRERSRLREWRERGVHLWFLVHDILPATHPEWFPGHVPPVFHAWLQVLSELAEGCVCVSRATADSLAQYWREHGLDRLPRLEVCHNGCDVPAEPAGDAPLPNAPFFLMVGTIEPRKGYRQVLSAMRQCWLQGDPHHLVIVGREGWQHDSAADRAPVAALARLLREHPEAGRRVHWLEGADDRVLAAAYQRAEALIAASEDEGFGLPLIEAAYFGTPVIARDIPVFREVAGEAARYFTAPPDSDPQGLGLAALLASWSTQDARHAAPRPARGWREQGRHLRGLLHQVLGENFAN